MLQLAGSPGRLTRGKCAWASSPDACAETAAERTPKTPIAAAIANTHSSTHAMRRPPRPRRSVRRSSIASEVVDVDGLDEGADVGMVRAESHVVDIPAVAFVSGRV